MRVLLTAQPGWGHVLPVLATATTLKRRGHDVLVATGAQYVAAAERAGIPAIATGIDWNLARAHETFPHLNELAGLERTLALRDLFHGATVAPFLNDLLRVADAFVPDVVVSETWELTGGAVAESRGVAAIHLSVVALTLPSSFAIIDAIQPHLDVRDTLGLPPLDHVGWAERRRSLFGLPKSWFLPGLEPGPNVTVTRPPVLGARQSARAPEWVVRRDPSVPLVLATLGTVFWDNTDVLRRVIESAAGEPYEMVVAIGDDADPTSLAPAPANVRIERYVPFSAVLPVCAAVVTHGGFGTTGAAVTAGTPMVMLPVGADQFVTAGQVERLGIGVVVTGANPIEIDVAGVTGAFVNPATLTAEEIRDATRRVLTDEQIGAAVAAQRSEVEAIPADAAAVAIEDAAQTVTVR